jgi:hypothetical protein
MEKIISLKNPLMSMVQAVALAISHNFKAAK